MLNKAHSGERSLLVTFRGLDKQRLSVTRYALGKNGKVRPISLAVPFQDHLAYRRFLASTKNGTLQAGKNIQLRLEKTTGEHRCAVAVDFSLPDDKPTE
jgi:hypothetical protein